MRHRLLLCLVLIATACNGPLGLLPGGKLDGEVGPMPASWAFAGASGQVQLETRPDDPYSVNVNYTIVDGRLYVNAGNTETAWVKNIEANPNVRLRMEGRLYSLRAERVTDLAEIARFGKAWTSQSMFRRDPAQFDKVWIYTLVPH